jgi:glyoxylase-like metal-dependent hydrolase (beta-lactamase superfamily II)
MDQRVEYSTENFDVLKIRDGVYACIHRSGGRAIGNSGVVDMGGSTVIFDTFLSPEAAEELIEAVERLGLPPVATVINSHYHNDHIRGNQAFSPQVRILSTRRTAELIEAEEPKSIASEKIYAKKQFESFDAQAKAFQGDTSSREYQIIRMMKPYFEELSKSHEVIRTRLPDTFVVNERSLDGSKRTVRLMDMGKGHTESDLIMVLSDEGIVFAGDLVFNDHHPYLGDGYPREWKRALTELESMKISTVVPGHGEPGGKEIIRATREYIESLERMVERMVKDGKGIDDLRNVRIPDRYKGWWLANYFHPNLERLYNDPLTR